MKKTATFKDTFKVKKAGDGSVVIEGWANKAVVDRGGDLLGMEAWDLNNYKKSGIMLFNHDRDKPIGKMLEVRATEQGLWIKGKISSSKDPFISYVRDLVAEGVLNAFSVGFESKNESKNADGINEIKQAELYEVSVVTLPMNQDSLFSLSSKSMDGLEYKDVKKKILKEKGAAVAAAVHQALSEDGMDRAKFEEMVLEKAGIDAEMLTQVLAGNVTPVPEAVLYAFSDTLGLDLEALKKVNSKEAPAKEEETPAEESKEAPPCEDVKPEEKASKPDVGVIAIQIPKDAVDDAEAAAAWAKENGWAADKVEENDDFYVVYQDDPTGFGEGTSSVDIGDGVLALVGLKKASGENQIPGDQTPTAPPPDAEKDPLALEDHTKTKVAIPATQGGEPVTEGNPAYEQARQTNVLLGAMIEVMKEMSAKLDKVVVQSEQQTEEHVEEQAPMDEEDPKVAKMLHDANLKLESIMAKLKSVE